MLGFVTNPINASSFGTTLCAGENGCQFLPMRDALHSRLTLSRSARAPGPPARKTSMSIIGSVAVESAMLSVGFKNGPNRERGWRTAYSVFDSRPAHPLRLLPPPSAHDDQGMCLPPAIRPSPNPAIDMEHEEDRGGSRQEEAKDQCGPDSCPEGWVLSVYPPPALAETQAHKLSKT